MPDYELSVKAEHDLTEIYIFSYHNFGEAKADAYLIGLDECFCHLANESLLGRKIDTIRKGYLRYEHIGQIIKNCPDYACLRSFFRVGSRLLTEFL